MYIAKLSFYFFNVFIHMVAYLLFSIIPFKQDLRYGKKKTILFSLLFVMFFCAADILFFENNAPFVRWRFMLPSVTLFIGFSFAFLIIKRHYFQLLFIVMICFTFHINFIMLSDIITLSYPLPTFINWFPEFNDLLIQFFILLVFLPPMWYLSSKLLSKVADNGIDILEWKFTAILPLSLMILSQLLKAFFMNYTICREARMSLSLLVMFISYFSYLSVLKIILMSNDKQVDKQRELIVQKQIDLQKATMRELSRHIFESARERHNWRQHYYTLEGLISRGEIDKAKCENQMIDALMKHYIVEAKAIGVLVSTLMTIPNDIMIDEVELCVVIGNIVENAVEACKRQKNGDRNIDIKANLVGKQLLFIVSNTYDGAIIVKNGDYYSSKVKNKVGQGIDSVKQIVLKNGGDISIGYEDGKFKVSIILNLE